MARRLWLVVAAGWMVLLAVGCSGQEADRAADGQVLAGPAGSTADAGEQTDRSDAGVGGEGSEGTRTSLDLADADFEDLVAAAMGGYGDDEHALAAEACKRRLSVDQARAIVDDPTLELLATPMPQGVQCAYPRPGEFFFSDISWDYTLGRTPEDVAKEWSFGRPDSIVPVPEFGEGVLAFDGISTVLFIPEGDSVITAKAFGWEWTVELAEALQAGAN